MLEHQYPGPISGNENMLAELMMPDQVHNRKEDWTIFFLHKDFNEDEDAAEGVDSEKKQDVDESEDEDGLRDGLVAEEGKNGAREDGSREEQGDAEGGEEASLIHVLNLVNTKHDPSAKRFVQTS